MTATFRLLYVFVVIESQCSPIHAIAVENRMRSAPVLSSADCIRNTASRPSVLDRIVADHNWEHQSLKVGYRHESPRSLDFPLAQRSAPL